MNLFQNEHTAVVFIDVEKVFYTVWHDSLLHNMLPMNIHISVVKIITSFLPSGRSRSRLKKNSLLFRQSRWAFLRGYVFPSHYSLFIPMIYWSAENLALRSLWMINIFFQRQKCTQRPTTTLETSQLSKLADDWFHKYILIVNSSKTVVVMIDKIKLHRILSIIVQNTPFTWSH